MRDEQAEFCEWYARYPRKVARADAWRAWQRMRFERPALPEMIAATARYVAWRTHLQSRNEFCPPIAYPATWLNGARWADEFDLPATAAPALSAEARAQAEVDAAAAEAERSRQRMAQARATAAWREVLDARRARSMPLGGFQDARAGQVLAAVGGWRALDGCSDAKALHALGAAFEAAYLRESAPSGRVVELKQVGGAR